MPKQHVLGQRRDRKGDTIHELAPSPEIVGSGSAIFGKPRHSALEGMAVQVRNPWEADRVTLIARFGASPSLD